MRESPILFSEQFSSRLRIQHQAPARPYELLRKGTQLNMSGKRKIKKMYPNSRPAVLRFKVTAMSMLKVRQKKAMLRLQRVVWSMKAVATQIPCSVGLSSSGRSWLKRTCVKGLLCACVCHASVHMCEGVIVHMCLSCIRTFTSSPPWLFSLEICTSLSTGVLPSCIAIRPALSTG